MTGIWYLVSMESEMEAVSLNIKEKSSVVEAKISLKIIKGVIGNSQPHKICNLEYIKKLL